MLRDSRHRPLPQGLRRRLLDIPRREVLCRDVDRLYRTALARARSGNGGNTIDAAAGAAERHLAECPRCREIYATLSSALAVRRLPLPRHMAARLSSIARAVSRPSATFGGTGQFLPVWITDTRYAAAACYLLAALALSLAGDASALLRDTTVSVSSRAQVWVDENEARGLEAWDATAAKLEEGVDDGWNRLMRYGASSERFFAGVLTTITTPTQELVPPEGDVTPHGGERSTRNIPGHDRPVEGDQDGKSGNDGR